MEAILSHGVPQLARRGPREGLGGSAARHALRLHLQRTPHAVLGLMACAIALNWLPGQAKWRRVESYSLPGIAWHYGAVRLLICSFGAGTVIFGFYTFDRFYLFLLSYFNQLQVQSIFAPGLWQSRTVKEFWRKWNLPVQRMLLNGIFKPLRDLGVSPDLSGTSLDCPPPLFFELLGLVVFLVSGAVHAWPLLCVGARAKQVGMKLGRRVQVL